MPAYEGKGFRIKVSALPLITSTIPAASFQHPHLPTQQASHVALAAHPTNPPRLDQFRLCTIQTYQGSEDPFLTSPQCHFHGLPLCPQPDSSPTHSYAQPMPCITLVIYNPRCCNAIRQPATPQAKVIRVQIIVNTPPPALREATMSI
jgi:hypothetical protein